MATKGQDYVTVAQAAAIIGVSARRVRAYIVAGQLPATLVTARMYLVPRSAAENFRRGLPGNPQLRAGAKKAGANGEAAAEKEKKSRRKT